MTVSEKSELANPFGKLTFLVVDDFENFRLSMRQMLRSCGAEHIELVGHAASAIQHCLYNPVDVVLCDYNLGEGRNGQHILEELRHRKLLKHSSLFLMVTAETSKEMVMGAREYQPDAYLTKPINRAVLEQRLGTLIRQRKTLLPINRAIDHEDYPKAISLCLELLPREPRHKTWLMKTLGELYIRVGDLAHAQKVYEDVLAQRELSWARLGRSKVLIATNQADTAIKHLQALIKDHPDYMEAYDLLAETLEQQGKTVPAQKILQRASEHSPNALLRHKHLAQLADLNQDLDSASEAWRQTVDLGSYSIHDAPEHYLSLANSLTDLCDGDDSAEGKQRAAEAITVLGQAEKRFADASEVPLRSKLIQSRVQAGQGNTAAARKLLDEAMEELVDDESLDADTGLDCAKTLFRLGDKKEAKTLLARLAAVHEGDAQIMRRIENLLDEPVGFRQKLQARSYNREGIKAFDAGDLAQAAETFKKALAIVPDHAALNLNLVQVLLKQSQQASNKRELLRKCQNHLEQLSALPEQHSQYRRYQALLQKLQGMMT